MTTAVTRADLAAVLGWPGPGVVAETGDDAITLHAQGQQLTCPWLRPDGPTAATVVLPWYDVDSLFAEVRPDPTLAVDRVKLPVADELLALGFAIVVVPWWAEELARRSAATDLAGRYGPPTTTILAQGWRTGLARSVADVLAVVDALAADPARSGRLAIWGHSLAGKLSLFSAALDERLQACVTHELGLGWPHSNWFDPWYLGQVRPDFDCDAVLALVAPRPLLYGAGHGFDSDPSLAMARSVRVGDWTPTVLEHRAGHRPSARTRQESYAWLAAQLLR